VLPEHGHHDVPFWLTLSPTLAMTAGFLIAWYCYMWQPLLPFGLLKRFPATNRFLLHAWYFDALYDRLFVRPAKWLGNFLWKYGDGAVIDGIGPNGIAARVLDITNRVVRLQSGYIYHYAFVMLIGVALLITYFIVAGGALTP
jgi:NADH-quinone oxidoreductase subunit L